MNQDNTKIKLSFWSNENMTTWTTAWEDLYKNLPRLNISWRDLPKPNFSWIHKENSQSQKNPFKFTQQDILFENDRLIIQGRTSNRFLNKSKNVDKNLLQKLVENIYQRHHESILHLVSKDIAAGYKLFKEEPPLDKIENKALRDSKNRINKRMSLELGITEFIIYKKNYIYINSEYIQT